MNHAYPQRLIAGLVVAALLGACSSQKDSNSAQANATGELKDAKKSEYRELAAKGEPDASAANVRPEEAIQVQGTRAAKQESANMKHKARERGDAAVPEALGKASDKIVAYYMERVPGVTMPPAPRPVAQDMAPPIAAAPMVAATPALPYSPPPPPKPELAADTAQYDNLADHAIVRVAEAPVSTFSVDVDTGSYSNARRFLRQGQLPPGGAVRVEEMINYFPYQYALPKADSKGQAAPFGVTTEIAPSPWNANNHLLRIGIKASDTPVASLPPANLVFLVDVSGSMNAPERLPLVKVALRKLSSHIRPQDRVSMVIYASGTGVVLEPTSDQEAIVRAIDKLVPGGSTAGAAGIDLAYQMAQKGFISGGINRILLATDGDFNVGITNFDQLKQRVAEKRKSGIALSTLGFGTHNYNEKLMEQLADAGDGKYSYIDNENEAHKVMVDEISATLATVAKDVKIQLEFNPKLVSEYRQIGYENRALKREDFNNDKVDAGDIGSGHTVTALYEITLADKPGSVEPLRYGDKEKFAKPSDAKASELAWLRLRYKKPDGDTSRLLEFPLHKADIKAASNTSEDWRFAAAVAAFGQQLKGGKYLGLFDWPAIRQMAVNARGDDKFGYRREFVELVDKAIGLSTAKGGVPIETKVGMIAQ